MLFTPRADSLPHVLACYGMSPRTAGVEVAGELGGLSGSRFWRVTEGERQWLLRQSGPHEPEQRIRNAHRALAWAAEQGVEFLPLPRVTLQGDTVVEHDRGRWQMLTWLPGQAAGGDRMSEAQFIAACRGLARFHHALANLPDHPQASARPFSIAHRVKLQAEATSQEWLGRPFASDGQLGALFPLAQSLASLVVKLLPRASELLKPVANTEFPVQTIHGDARCEHFLFDGDRLTGLVDFGAMTFDTPAVDLARLFQETEGVRASVRQSGISAYAEVAPLSEQERRLVQVLAESGAVLAAFRWLKWLFVEQRELGPPEQVRRRLARLECRLQALWQT